MLALAVWELLAGQLLASCSAASVRSCSSSLQGRLAAAGQLEPEGPAEAAGDAVVTACSSANGAAGGGSKVHPESDAGPAENGGGSGVGGEEAEDRELARWIRDVCRGSGTCLTPSAMALQLAPQLSPQDAAAICIGGWVGGWAGGQPGAVWKFWGSRVGEADRVGCKRVCGEYRLV